ncbi:MAG TPA: SH3 domain-containing protein [Pseudolabrys sp.]|nr:SH3 domain-containing protein [Pseudolabrys sp.]
MSFKSVMLAGVALLASAGAASAAVVENDLNLRSGPGTGYAVIDVMPAGASVDVLSCTGGWCRVAYAGETGYASRSYLGGATTAYVAPPAYTYAPAYEYGPYAYDYGYSPYDYGYYDYGPTIGFGFFGGTGFYRHHHYRHFGHRHFGNRHFANRHFRSGNYRNAFASAPSGFERNRAGGHFGHANVRGHAGGHFAGNFTANRGAMHMGGGHFSGGGRVGGGGHAGGHIGGGGGHHGRR